MKITRAYKVELDPNNEQRTALLRHCGAARFVYNWGLAHKIEAREKGEKVLNWQKLDGVLRSIIDEEFPWLRETSKWSRQVALANLDNAYKAFFDRCKKGKKGKATGFPKFKSRKSGIGGFGDFAYIVRSDSIKLSCIGRVRLKESNCIPLGGYGKNTDTIRFYGARITERAGRWFVSVHVEIEVPDAIAKTENIIGVDMGVKSLAVASNGLTFENPKALKCRERKLKRLSRQLSRKVKGSTNRKKAARRVAVLHAKVADVRRHTLHHVSHVLTRKASVLVIEDLNVQGMMKNHHLAQAIGDASFGELRRQLTYKSQWRGVELVVAPRFFPSSKTCFSCGAVNADLKLSHRVWSCECGARVDRDLNAALNLRNVAASRAETLNACGGESSGEPLAARETSPREAGSGLETCVSLSPASSENGSNL
ncbi:transposase [bacterium]|nr:MAG: transposase [bacterium]